MGLAGDGCELCDAMRSSRRNASGRRTHHRVHRCCYLHQGDRESLCDKELWTTKVNGKIVRPRWPRARFGSSYDIDEFKKFNTSKSVDITTGDENIT